MKVIYLDTKSNEIYTIQTFVESPLFVPSVNSEIKLPNNKRYLVLKSFADMSKIENSDHFHVVAKVTLKEIPDD